MALFKGAEDPCCADVLAEAARRAEPPPPEEAPVQVELPSAVEMDLTVHLLSTEDCERAGLEPNVKALRALMSDTGDDLVDDVLIEELGKEEQRLLKWAGEDPEHALTLLTAPSAALRELFDVDPASANADYEHVALPAALRLRSLLVDTEPYTGDQPS